jgi:hypothetical protein
MKTKCILFVLVVLFFSTLPLSAQDIQTVEIKEIVFQWEIVNDDIIIILSAPTKGWIAVGFEPSRMMKDADILIGYVKDGETFMEDHYGSGNTKHQADLDLGGTNDITIIGGSELNDITMLNFSIPLHSLDSNDRILEKGEEYKLIFAYGKRDDFKSYHKVRTSMMLTL